MRHEPEQQLASDAHITPLAWHTGIPLEVLEVIPPDVVELVIPPDVVELLIPPPTPAVPEVVMPPDVVEPVIPPPTPEQLEALMPPDVVELVIPTSAPPRSWAYSQPWAERSALAKRNERRMRPPAR